MLNSEEKRIYSSLHNKESSSDLQRKNLPTALKFSRKWHVTSDAGLPLLH